MKLLPSSPSTNAGSSKGANELDSLRLIDPGISKLEPNLMHTKWWDYRLMHPVECTRYWAARYSDAVARFATMTAGRDGSKSAYFGIDPLKTRDATACIYARQALDRLGVRYPWALEWMVQRFSDRGWLAFPRPNQLYGEELLLDLADAWKLEQKARLQLPESPYFREPGSRELRDLYRAHAIKAALARSTPDLAWMPLSTLLRERLVGGDDLLRHGVPKHTVERALLAVA